MTVEHKDIVDPNIHESKGVNTAVINTFYKANGAGSGSWSKIPTQGLSGVSSNGVLNQSVSVDGSGNHKLLYPVSHGETYFVNIGTPNVITYPGSYTKINPTTTPLGGSVEFTEGATSILTYTGTEPRFAVVSVTASISHAGGADRDIRLVLYKNGAIIPSSESISTITTATKRSITTFANVALVTNDTLEAYIKNDGASGDVSIYTFKLQARAYLS